MRIIVKTGTTQQQINRTASKTTPSPDSAQKRANRTAEKTESLFTRVIAQNRSLSTTEKLSLDPAYKDLRCNQTSSELTGQ